MKGSRLRRWILLLVAPALLGGLVLLLPVHAPIELTRVRVPAGADSVQLVPGERYRAGRLRRALLGTRYRELWTHPVTVEVLQLHDFAGGLTPVKEGGGMETRSLHFSSGAGPRYVFRSVDKEITRLLPHGLDRSLLGWAYQDQTSSAHPAGTLVAARLQAAVGLPGTHPRLVVLPDDGALGPFRARFAGLLGTLQEAPGESGDSAGPRPVKHSDELLVLLDSVPGNRVDTRAFLTARLLDFFLNDWDRHAGQWRWIGQAEPWGTLWRPIPVDRDQAFAWYDGALMDVARLRTSKLSRFGPDYPHLRGLIRNSGDLDRRLLAGLARPVWDSIAGFLEARLSDSVIADAVRAMPEPWWQSSGSELVATLKLRRAGLHRIGTEFYDWLARQPEVHVAGEQAHLTRHPDGSLELWLGSAEDGRDAAAGFARTFLPGETQRVDLHLHGNGTRPVVGGKGPEAIEVRVFDGQGRAVPPPRPEGP